MVMMADLLVDILERREARLRPPPVVSEPARPADASSATWAKDAEPAASSPAQSAVWSAASSPDTAGATPGADSMESPEPTLAELEQPDFERLEGLGMPGEMAETVLSKLDQSIADLPV
jgi:hypothetical protein